MLDNTYLSFGDLFIASLLMLISLAVSRLLSLKLERDLLIGTIRTVVQLSFIGLILAWVFAREQSLEILSIMTIMTLIAAWAVRQRVAMPYKGISIDAIVSTGLAAWLVALIGLLFILRAEPWYRPQFAIPVLGLVLGNTLTGISLTMNHFIQGLHSNRQSIEMHLSLSASAWEACRNEAVSAIKNGMIPTINSMMVVGLVSLPGMMTGQILAGADPEQAVRYQIITMFLISAGCALGCMLSVLLVYKRFFDDEQRLCLDKHSRTISK